MEPFLPAATSAIDCNKPRCLYGRDEFCFISSCDWMRLFNHRRNYIFAKPNRSLDRAAVWNGIQPKVGAYRRNTFNTYWAKNPALPFLLKTIRFFKAQKKTPFSFNKKGVFT